MSWSLGDLLARGGVLMYPLLALGAWGALIIVERGLYFLFALRETANPLVDEVLSTPDEVAATTPLARILLAAARAPLDDSWRLHVEHTLHRERRELYRGIGWLAVIGGLAPLLGLLGTIVGLIQMFLIVEQTGGNTDPALLAGGIWQALLTTAVGLTIAVPTMLLYYLLRSLARLREERWIRLAEEVRLRRLHGAAPPA